MRAAIRRFHSPDIDRLDSWKPAAPSCFGFLLQVLIGPADGEGEESFDFVVCTPEWLGKHYAGEDFVFGRHHLIVFKYEFPLIASAIEGIVAQATGATWAELAAQLARYGHWEFEDFRG